MDDSFRLNLDLDQVPKELKFILEVINLEDVDKDSVQIREQIKEWVLDIDWKLVLELAIHHRLYPLLYVKLKKMEKDLIPYWVVESLFSVYKINTFQMLHLSGEMEQLGKVFKENLIRLLVLKGPVLASDLYGDLSLRTCGDLDVLVSITDLDRVENILSNLGYVKDDYIETVLNDWKWRHHHFTYYHPKKGIKLEVHWRLNPFPGKEPNFEELWERKRVSSLTNNAIYFLGREDLFLFLASHGSRHGWSRLRWLVDIRQMMKQKVDWCDLYKQLKKYQYLHVGGQAIVLACELLNATSNEGMKKIIQNSISKKLAQRVIFYLENMVNLHSYPVPKYVSAYHSSYLFSLMTIRQKPIYILSFLYPYPDDAETLPLPKLLHFLYFPLRPFLWAWRKTRKLAFQ